MKKKTDLRDFFHAIILQLVPILFTSSAGGKKLWLMVLFYMMHFSKRRQEFLQWCTYDQINKNMGVKSKYFLIHQLKHMF